MTRRLSFRIRPLVRFLAGGLLASQLAVLPTVYAAEGGENPKVAIQAVQNTLPSVAILGQKKGPSDTTEVFIQVPGVLNMQSVYVLGDGETVISGVIVPPVEHGFPGGAITLPDGNASVDPRQPRENADQVSQALGLRDSDEPKPSVQTAESNQVSSVPAPSATRSLDANEKAGSKEQNQTPPVSAPAAAPKEKEASASTAEAVAEPGSATASPSKTHGVKVRSGVDGETGKDTLVESLDDVAGSGAFSKLVGYALENDSDIDQIRNMGNDPEKSQKAYLDLVKGLPAVVQGEGDRKIYVLFDPNCPVCHRYYNEVSLKVASGQVQVHWIPAIVFPDNRSSLTASAALLAELQRQDGDALSMLDSVMTDASFNSQIDASPGVDKLVPYLGGVIKNTAVMAMARAETPLLVFEKTDGTLGISPGIPKSGYTSLIKSES